MVNGENFSFSVCTFPYIIAFTTDSMEIRLIINGNLVQTMNMPKLTLISSKVRKQWSRNFKGSYLLCMHICVCMCICFESTLFIAYFQNDIYFATTAPEFFQGKMERLQLDQKLEKDQSISPPSSPHCKYFKHGFRGMVEVFGSYLECVPWTYRM